MSEMREMEREASCETTSPARLAELAEINEELALLVAKNPATPAPILDSLALDKILEVRINVAKHRNTSAATLAVLARDTRFKVRQEVVSNPNTEISSLKRLAKDKKGLIGVVAKDRLTRLQMK